MKLGEYMKLEVPVPGTHPVRLPRQTGQVGVAGTWQRWEREEIQQKLLTIFHKHMAQISQTFEMITSFDAGLKGSCIFAWGREDVIAVF